MSIGSQKSWSPTQNGVRQGFTTRSLLVAGVVFLSFLAMSFCGPSFGRTLPSPAISIDFSQLSNGVAPQGVTFTTQFKGPDVVPGPSGTAWRTDGFSSYVEAPVDLKDAGAFTLSVWVALESYPSDLEVPVDMLSPSSIAQQFNKGKGFDLYLDTFGRWGLRVGTNSGVVDARALNKFELGKWVHIVATVDTSKGQATIYKNGEIAGRTAFKPGTQIEYATGPLRLAVPAVSAKIINFNINRINGAYANVSLYPTAFEPEMFSELPGPRKIGNDDAADSLVVPSSRFAGDVLRPTVHPIPPANWTNEPHGLLRYKDRWHLFYQRTPNGPFKSQMVWGHMSSDDLVTWSHHRDALRPELQSETFGFDMKGIWSGHVIADKDKAVAFYTSVNHRDRLAANNPGIAMAVSTDSQLNEWKKLGPILNSEGLRDFRDPYVWKEGESWHMVVGAALESGGGLAYYRLIADEKGGRWQKQSRFSQTSFRVLDIGSEIWEMPVFEKLNDKLSILAVNPVGASITKYGASATRTIYWIGEWKDGLFRPLANEAQNLDLLPGHLAPTASRAQDGSLRAIGIIDERRTPESQKLAGWANTFGLPRHWYLMPNERTLGQSPAPELLKLRDPDRTTNKGTKLSAIPTHFNALGQAYELEVDIDPARNANSTVHIDVLVSADQSEFTRLTFDPLKREVSVDKASSSRSADAEGPQIIHGAYDANAFGPMKKIRVFVDGSVIEVFINDAASYGIRSYPTNPSAGLLRISASESSSTFVEVKTWALRTPDK